MSLQSASLPECFVKLLKLPASSLTWRQAPKVRYLLDKELVFNLLSAALLVLFHLVLICAEACLPSHCPLCFESLTAKGTDCQITQGFVVGRQVAFSQKGQADTKLRVSAVA